MGIRFAPNRMSILCTTLHFSPRSSLYYTLFNPARKKSLPKVKRYISGWRIWTVANFFLGYPFRYTKSWYCNMIWGIKGGIESSTRTRKFMGVLVLIPFRLQIINVGWVGGLKSRSFRALEVPLCACWLLVPVWALAPDRVVFAVHLLVAR